MAGETFPFASLFATLTVILTLAIPRMPVSVVQAQSAGLSAADSTSNHIHVPEVLQDGSLMFIENIGQFPQGAYFQATGRDQTVWFAENAIWVTVSEQVSTGAEKQDGKGEIPSDPLPEKGVNIRLSFPGSNPHPHLEPFNRLETHASFFLGEGPAKWQSDVPTWGGVRYIDLYPGIDLEVRGEQGQLVPRLVADPSADLSPVQLQVDGAERIELLSGDESLHLTTAVGDFALPLLQAPDSVRTTPLRPTLSGHQVAFPFASTIHSPQSAIRNPQFSDLLYSTFLGGGEHDVGSGIAVDSSGAAYVTGWTRSPDFPTTPGAFDTTYNGGDWDAFVTKLDATGTDVAYVTFLGGYDQEASHGIVVDSSGAAYITGLTISPDFPTTPGAFDTTYDGPCETFVVKLNTTGTGLAYATFLGGSSWEYGTSIAIDSSGAAYVTGYTASPDFPTTPGAFDTTFNGSELDAFVAKLDAAGNSLLYSTFLGSSDHDWGEGIAVDSSGAAYVTGWTSFPDFPTTPGAYDTTFNGNLGDSDAFVVKLNSTGSALTYSTFLGGSDFEQDLDLAVDSSGAAYITGQTRSLDFPTTPGAFDTTYNGGDWDAFVAKLDMTGTDLVYSTFLGGIDYEETGGIAVDSSGGAYVTGFTVSPDFPATPGAFDTTYNNCDAFVVKLDTAGASLAYATFLGGSDSDIGGDIVVDSSGVAYLTGETASLDFPITPGAFDTTLYVTEVFMTKLAVGGGPGPTQFSISHIEVTQIVQDEANSVPLIAGKPTAVRVYVDCGVGCTSLPGVTGILRAYGPSGELTPQSPRRPLNGPITAYHESWLAQRGDLDKALNFSLSQDWVTMDSITLTAEVNGVTHSQIVTFLPARELDAVYIPIYYKGQGPDPIRIQEGARFARVYPTARMNYVPGITLEWNKCLKKDLFCPLWESNRGSLLNKLTTIWRYYYEGSRVFGWLPDDVWGGGTATVFPNATVPFTGGVRAIGDDDPQHGQRIFAHEYAHLLGRPHTADSGAPKTCGNPTPNLWSDWPYSDAMIQDWGIDTYGFGWLGQAPDVLKDPSEMYDYMSYCWYWNDEPAWTSGFTYRQIYAQTLQVQTEEFPNENHPVQGSFLIVSGLVYTDDLATIDPVWAVTTTTIPEMPPEGSQYCLETQDPSGIPLSVYCFDLAFAEHDTGEPTSVDGFNFMLPYSDNLDRIVLRKGSLELATRFLSEHIPDVTVLSPNGGETWTATNSYTITWSASDTDGDPLAYNVFYSSGENDWVPIQVAITETQLVVNSSELAGGNGAKVRVVVSDGINNNADESDAPFTVERKAPQVYILWPDGDGLISPRTPLYLEGYGYDLEDGVLGDSGLQWTSSLEGYLGSGRQIEAELSSGQHMITLTATDSDGNTSTATIHILVGYRIHLPLVLRRQ